eukprot:Nk52_evm42s1360 gene=Nk52_evmTU42s1360
MVLREDSFYTHKSAEQNEESSGFSQSSVVIISILVFLCACGLGAALGYVYVDQENTCDVVELPNTYQVEKVAYNPVKPKCPKPCSIHGVCRAKHAEDGGGYGCVCFQQTEGEQCEKSTQNSKTRYLLSLDGGGIRGRLTAAFLGEMEKTMKKTHPDFGIRKNFDMFAGTSTGSILAAGLGYLHNIPVEDIESVFGYDNSKVIFGPGDWTNSNTLKCKYGGEGKTEVLRSYFGPLKFNTGTSDLTNVVIVSYDLTSGKGLAFKNWKSEFNTLDVADCVDCSSAAPTYFPPHSFGFNGQTTWCVDGGVTANNPTLVALSEMFNLYPTSNIKVLSVGTGHGAEASAPAIAAQPDEWGILTWFSAGLIDIMQDTTLTDGILSNMMPEGNYIRVEHELLKASPALDHYSPSDLNYYSQEGRAWWSLSSSSHDYEVFFGYKNSSSYTLVNDDATS